MGRKVLISVFSLLFCFSSVPISLFAEGIHPEGSEAQVAEMDFKENPETEEVAGQISDGIELSTKEEEATDKDSVVTEETLGNEVASGNQKSHENVFNFAEHYEEADPEKEYLLFNFRPEVLFSSQGFVNLIVHEVPAYIELTRLELTVSTGFVHVLEFSTTNGEAFAGHPTNGSVAIAGNTKMEIYGKINREHYNDYMLNERLFTTITPILMTYQAERNAPPLLSFSTDAPSFQLHELTVRHETTSGELLMQEGPYYGLLGEELKVEPLSLDDWNFVERVGEPVFNKDRSTVIYLYEEVHYLTPEDLDNEQWLMDEVTRQGQVYYNDGNKSVEDENIPYEFLSKITHIALGNTDIEGVLPPSIKKLSNLIHFDISNTRIRGSIPKEIGELDKIQLLELSNTLLSGRLPEALGNIGMNASVQPPGASITIGLQGTYIVGQIPDRLFQRMSDDSSSAPRILFNIRDSDLTINRADYSDLPPELALEITINSTNSFLPIASGGDTTNKRLYGKNIVNGIYIEPFNPNSDSYFDLKKLETNGEVSELSREHVFEIYAEEIDETNLLYRGKWNESLTLNLEAFKSGLEIIVVLDEAPLNENNVISITRPLPIVPPLDPLNPEVEVNPENQPEQPENPSVVSIDFVSQFNFGERGISAKDQEYFALPQRILTEEGVEPETRPNYIQISDRRPASDRGGWTLSVRQTHQFRSEDGHELTGSKLSLLNGEMLGAQSTTSPGMVRSNPTELVPGGDGVPLIIAGRNEGEGTWLYRFGDADTAGDSIRLEVPGSAAPRKTTYTTSLEWQLQAVPGN